MLTILDFVTGLTLSGIFIFCCLIIGHLENVFQHKCVHMRPYGNPFDIGTIFCLSCLNKFKDVNLPETAKFIKSLIVAGATVLCYLYGDESYLVSIAVGLHFLVVAGFLNQHCRFLVLSRCSRWSLPDAVRKLGTLFFCLGCLGVLHDNTEIDGRVWMVITTFLLAFIVAAQLMPLFMLKNVYQMSSLESDRKQDQVASGSGK